MEFQEIMIDDVIINKTDTIKRCLDRIDKEFTDSESFKKNYTKQDSVILNLERISQASIDIATHIIRVKKLGIPKSSKELFSILEQYQYISKTISLNMQKMVGFRNIAVHDYQNLNIEIVISIVKNNLDDFINFSNEILKKLSI